MANVKLQDIANAAGVSMMTVSRVMNNDPKVGDKTREKVSAIAKKMRYKPNIAARNLAASKSYSIALVCEYANASYVNRFLVGTLRQSRISGYHMVLDETTNDPKTTLEVIQNLINVSRVDGLVLLPPVSDNREVIDLLTKTKTKFVRIAPNSDMDASPSISMDDYQAAYEMTQHLINAGHKRIAHVMGNAGQGVSQKRYQGYLDALRDHHQIMLPDLVQAGDFTYKSGLVAGHKLFDLETRPDAIFASNDEMAAAIMAVAHMKRLDIPNDVSIVGFDDTELATTVWPDLTTVSQPLEDMAELAIQLLTSPKSSTDEPSSLLQHVLDYQLQIRNSSKNDVVIL